MITALIFAGGTGKRMNSKSKPKQFLELYGKPVIIHTLEYFEEHEMVDNIAVVCIEGWINYLKEELKRYDISKVKWVVEGGKTGQESIRNGLTAIYRDYGNQEDAIVLIHDGVRPLISENLITECIESVNQYGSAITITSVKETIASVDGTNSIKEIANRKETKIAKAPQCFYLNEIVKCHERAVEEDITDFVDSASMMLHYGYNLHTVVGPEENIKITTASDYYIFRAILEARENSQIFGI